MIIKTLVENTSVSEKFKNEHGLSLYIETQKHKLLFDMGKTDLFLENAKNFGVNIADVDIAVISHGHYDHGGGLKAFLEVNSKAKIYIKRKAFGKYYSLRPNGITAYIGLDEELKKNERFIFVDDYLKIDNEFELFSNIKGKEFLSSANNTLLMGNDTQVTKDTFAHEQNLIITQYDENILIAGCAHNGIVNIVKHANLLKNKQIDYVVGGFHLYNPSSQNSEPKEMIEQIANYLLETKAKYYTCHCTGLEPYSLLKEIMQNNIDYISAGSEVKIYSVHAKKAMGLFKQGFNCSQSVFGAFCDEMDIDFETAMKMSSSFGGGMGRLREVCGAVTGMFMVAGMKYGYSDPTDKKAKTEHYKLIQTLGKEFEAKNSSMICRELLGLNVKNDSPVPEERTDEYYKKRPCAELVGDAAEMLDNILKINS